MNTAKLIAAASLSLLAAVGAHAESYEGVHPLVSANNRTSIRTEAVVASHSENPFAEGASSHVAPRLTASTNRFAVRQQAVVSAHEENPYSDSYGQGVTTVSRGIVSRAATRAEGVAAAHGQALPL